MHGLINRSIECFLRDTYGDATWQAVMAQANLGFSSFEAMLSYEDEQTFIVLACASKVLNKSPTDVLQDLGTYLVTGPKVEFLRRLLRFGGDGFVDFLHSLEDLQDRARLAVPDLDLPRFELIEEDKHRYHLQVWSAHVGFGDVMVGVLRALADDYGALVYLERTKDQDGAEGVSIALLYQRPYCLTFIQSRSVIEVIRLGSVAKKFHAFAHLSRMSS